MNHEDWVRQELRKLSRSLGFHYTPLDEIESRLDRIRTRMEKQGIEALLVVQKMDFYYLSGTTQDGLLFLPFEGNPLLMIKRELERAKGNGGVSEITIWPLDFDWNHSVCALRKSIIDSSRTSKGLC